MNEFAALSDDELSEKVARLEKELLRRRRDWTPRPLATFSVEEKSRAFDEIHSECTEWIASARDKEDWNDDADTMIGRNAMECIFGNDIYQTLERFCDNIR